MLALFAVTLLFAYSKYRTTASTEEEPEGEKLADFVSDKNNMLLTVVLLVVTGAIMLLLLFKNVNVSQSANYDEFNQKMSIFFVGLMATMSVCMVWKFLGKQVALWLGSGLVVVSVIAAVAGSIIGFNGLVAFSLPSYAVAVGASAFRFAKSRVAGSFRKTLQRASPHLIHMGVALVLLSFVVSSNMQSFPSDLERVQGTNGTVMSLGDQVNVGGFTVKLVSLNVRNDGRTFGTTSVQLAQDATLDVLRSGSSLRTGVVLTNLYGVSNGKVGVIKVEVFVYKSALNDLYLDYQWMTNATAFVQMKVVPLMNILWAGFSLLVVGLTLRTVSWQQEPKLAGPPKKKEGRAQAKPSGTEPRGKDYEALVEEELRKYKEMRKS